MRNVTLVNFKAGFCKSLIFEGGFADFLRFMVDLCRREVTVQADLKREMFFA